MSAVNEIALVDSVSAPVGVNDPKILERSESGHDRQDDDSEFPAGNESVPGRAAKGGEVLSWPFWDVFERALPRSKKSSNRPTREQVMAIVDLSLRGEVQIESGELVVAFDAVPGVVETLRRLKQ